MPDSPITPPPTPVWNQSPSRSFMNLTPSSTATASYPSPTSSSSRSSSATSLKPSFSTRSTSIRENVQVMVRCRPRSEKELKVDEEPCWLIQPEEGSIELTRLKSPSTIRTFHYDNVVMGVDNSQVYKAGIADLVRSAMMGYNGTVFAYGQTASGKTYTMMGTRKEPGVIPRAVQDVFSYIEEDTTGREYLLRVSYMEIYNEKIKDLLNVENTSPEIVEDKKGVYVRNLKEVIVKTANEVMNCIKEGEGNRHISATDYNAHSSRSHTIFQLVIESRSKGLSSSTNRGVRVSQLNLIDLAGSEKVATDIERRKEGAYINKSLLTLGNVISKLTSNEPSIHIPFRNSKLTRILQAALSGNARISVICTINPTFASKDESLNTLKFAQRTKLVKTAAKMTRILDNSELQNCLIKIAELQTKMQEKNDLEAETRERLKNLLGLILTSSKDSHQDIQDGNDMLSRLTNMSSDDLVKETTMRDVVARCEEGFAAQIASHQKQMDKMSMNVESMQDMLDVMESVHEKQVDALAMRDAQIDKLKQELSAVKAIRPSKIPNTNTTNKIAVEDLTPVISLAVEKVTHAISSGLHVEDGEYDMVNSVHDCGLQQAIHGVFEGVIQSTLNKNEDVKVDTSAVVQAVKQGIISSTPTPLVQVTTIAPEFIPIHEAVSFIVLDDHHYHTIASTCSVEPVVEDKEEDLPTLLDSKQQSLPFSDLEEEEPLHVNDSADEESDYDENEEDEDEENILLATRNQVCISSDSEVEIEQVQVQSLQHPVIKPETPANDLKYEPYGASIEQPSPISFIFSRWTFLLIIIAYFLWQF